MIKSFHTGMPSSIRKIFFSWYPGYHGTRDTNIKAFTLIELLIVIAIVAILGSAITVVLNPAELLAQARDSQRLRDLESVKKSISLSLIDNPSLFQGLSSTNIYLSLPSCTGLTAPSGFFYVCSTTPTSITGSGWIPVSLSSLPNLPTDPVNSSSSSLYYAFIPDLINKTFVITSLLESEKYLKSASIKDGGTDPGRIEEGSPTLWTAASGLVGYWPMDEGSGTVIRDLSGNNYNANIYGNPIWTSVGCRAGGCLNYDGAGDSADTSLNHGVMKNGQESASWTLSVWVKRTADPGNEDIILGRRGCHGGLYTSGGGYDFAIKTTGCWTDSRSIAYRTTSQNMSEWHLLTGVYNNRSMNFFVNGNSAGTATFTALIHGYGNDVNIGGVNDLNNWHFNGLVDDARIYTRSLTESEIKAIYTAQK